MQKNQPVAFFVGHWPISIQKWFIEQVISLIDLGVDVRIFAFHRVEPVVLPADVVNYHLLDRTIYIDVPRPLFKKIVLGIYYFFVLLFSRPGALVRILKKGSAFGFSYVIKYIFWTGPLLGEIDECQIVHCHMGMIANRYLVIREILGLTQPFVTTFYGQDSSKYIKAKGTQVYNELKKEGEYLLTMTEEMRERMIDFGFPRDKTRVHYTGILVGRFVEKKGIPDILRAVSIAAKKYPHIELHIVGDGDDEKYNTEIQKAYVESNLGGRAIFRGPIPYDELQNVYGDMHLMVQLSKTAQNGDTDDLPVVLLEGQASGLPVLTTNHVGITDGLIDGKTGFMVAEGDYVAAAQKILYFIENPNSVSQMGKNARVLMEDRFDLIEIDKKLITLYEGLLKKSS
ncbi:MAG: Glycosyl transferase, group 1 family protein [Parcubacteria group bacterium GW2011_GWA2_47_7]|nr:MAG: Glycosyl transferase, group 1 family protein [Parcubacteria group bacterium GW2011_GWA2_47_7]